MVLLRIARGRDITQGVPGSDDEGQPDTGHDAVAPRPAPPPQRPGENRDQQDEEHRAHRAGHDQQDH